MTITKKSLTVRLPLYAHDKLESLRRRMGATQVQVLTKAIDDLETNERGYNGWSNYESWDVALWLDNDQGTYNHMQELVKDTREYTALPAEEGMIKGSLIGTLADSIEEFVTDDNPLTEDASMFSDLLQHALHRVDWHEVAKHYLED